MKAILALSVLLLAVAAAGVAQGSLEAQPLTTQRLQAIIDRQEPNTYLIDVRTPAEFASGAIPSAINIPYDLIGDNLPTQDRSARIIVYCRSGARASVAEETLRSLGFSNVTNFGGIVDWEGELVKPEE